MKIFAIYCKVVLSKKPEWLDGFRDQYDERGDLHITLKQPCLVGEELVEDVKMKFGKLFDELKISRGKIEVIFEKIKIDRESDGEYCVMIKANENDELMELQRKIVKVFAEYDNFWEIELAEYERNFQPHITIGRDVKQDKMNNVIGIVGEKCWCEGCVDEIVLSIVDENNDEEAKEMMDKTIVKLRGTD